MIKDWKTERSRIASEYCNDLAPLNTARITTVTELFNNYTVLIKQAEYVSKCKELLDAN